MHAETARSTQRSGVEERPARGWEGGWGRVVGSTGPRSDTEGFVPCSLHCELTLRFKEGNYVVSSVALEPSGHRRRLQRFFQ